MLALARKHNNKSHASSSVSPYCRHTDANSHSASMLMCTMTFLVMEHVSIPAGKTSINQHQNTTYAGLAGDHQHMLCSGAGFGAGLC